MNILFYVFLVTGLLAATGAFWLLWSILCSQTETTMSKTVAFGFSFTAVGLTTYMLQGQDVMFVSFSIMIGGGLLYLIWGKLPPAIKNGDWHKGGGLNDRVLPSLRGKNFRVDKTETNLENWR